MQKNKRMKNPNGYGTVVKLSGRRRCPYEVRVNTRRTGKSYPVYDVLGRFSDHAAALIALAEYNKTPYDVDAKNLTFAELYNLWFPAKYNGVREYSQSSINCTRAAFQNAVALHDVKIQDIRATHLQAVLDGSTLSHASIEHIAHLFKQVFAYAMKNDYITKNYAEYIHIKQSDDDMPGVPFTVEDIKKLWIAYRAGVPWAWLPLFLIYSGWRIGEAVKLSFDFENNTMQGGIKTAAGKNRVVPIFSGISDLLRDNLDTLPKSDASFRKKFGQALALSGITDKHTPHDCRHTFISLLDGAGVNKTIIKKLVGHAGGDITEKVYTHKTLEQLREAVETLTAY